MTSITTVTIIAVGFIAIIFLTYKMIWAFIIKRNAKKTLKAVLPIWAALWPFNSGAESANALMAAWYAYYGLDSMKEAQEVFNTHKEQYDKDPDAWIEVYEASLERMKNTDPSLIKLAKSYAAMENLNDDFVGEKGFKLELVDNADGNPHVVARHIESGEVSEIGGQEQDPQWSEHPGGYERQLQRRFNNILFPIERRHVTAEEVNEAKSRDNQTKNNLLKKIIEFNDNQPEDLPIDWQEYCSETRERVDELLSETYEVGGDISYILDVLTKYRRRAIETWKAGLSDNEAARKNLEKAEIENNKYNFLDNVFVRHASDEEYIPRSELAESLLTESYQNIQAYCKYLIYINDDNPIPSLLQVAEEIVTNAKAEQLVLGEITQTWEDKLEAIKSCINLTKEDLFK